MIKNYWEHELGIMMDEFDTVEDDFIEIVPAENQRSKQRATVIAIQLDSRNPKPHVNLAPTDLNIDIPQEMQIMSEGDHHDIYVKLKELLIY